MSDQVSTDAFVEFLSCDLPRDVTDYSYEEAVARLRLLFGKQRSVFADRYNCMRLIRDEGEEFLQLIIHCKAALKWFKFEELTKEKFDALILLSALESLADEPMRARILQKLNNDGEQVRFYDIITDCVDFLTTKADCQVLDKASVHLNAVRSHRRKIGNAASTHHLNSSSHPSQRGRTILRPRASAVDTSNVAKIAQI